PTVSPATAAATASVPAPAARPSLRRRIACVTGGDRNRWRADAGGGRAARESLLERGPQAELGDECVELVLGGDVERGRVLGQHVGDAVVDRVRTPEARVVQEALRLDVVQRALVLGV